MPHSQTRQADWAIANNNVLTQYKLCEILGDAGPAQVSKGSEGLERQLQQILFSQSQMMTFMKKQQSLYQNMKTELCEVIVVLISCNTVLANAHVVTVTCTLSAKGNIFLQTAIPATVLLEVLKSVLTYCDVLPLIRREIGVCDDVLQKCMKPLYSCAGLMEMLNRHVIRWAYSAASLVRRLGFPLHFRA